MGSSSLDCNQHEAAAFLEAGESGPEDGADGPHLVANTHCMAGGGGAREGHTGANFAEAGIDEHVGAAEHGDVLVAGGDAVLVQDKPGVDTPGAGDGADQGLVVLLIGEAQLAGPVGIGADEGTGSG